MKAGAYAEPSGSASPAGSNGVKAGVARWLVGLPLPVMGLALIIETISADIDAALVLLGAIALQLAGIGLVRRGLKTRQSGGVEAALNSPSPVLGLGLAALVAAMTAGGRDLGAPDCGATTLAVPGGGKPAGGAGAMGDCCVRAPDGCMAPGSVWPARGVPW